jgi:PST family polysaccharide transporter
MTEMQEATGRERVAGGAIITGASQIYRITLNFGSGVVLAWLLSPADFGLIAMVSSSLAFVALIQDLGLNQATIQRARISDSQMSALFWLSLGFSIILALLLAASAPAIASFFSDSRLIALTVAFSSLVVVSGAQSQQMALMSRHMRFKHLAVIDILTVTSSAVVGVAVAWLTSSYWALFFASVASSVVGLVSTWMFCSWRPGRPSFDGELKEILGFGSGVSGFNIVNYFARNADSLLIGRLYGADQLGLYNRAYRLMLFPLTQIQAPLGRVMLPLLSRLQADSDRYRKAYIECVSLLMMASQAGLVFASIFAEDVFLVLLGPQWVPAAPVFRWLGVAALHQVATATLGWLFLSQGRGGDFFKIGVLSAIATVASFIAGLPWGPVGVAIAYAIANYVVLLPLTWWSATRQGPIRTRDLVAAALPHAAATAACALVLMAAAAAVPTPGAAMCFGLLLLSYAAYGLVMLCFPTKRLMLGRNLRGLIDMMMGNGIGGARAGKLSPVPQGEFRAKNSD